MRNTINLVEYSQNSALHSVRPVDILRYASAKDTGEVHRALLDHMRASKDDDHKQIESWLQSQIAEAVQHVMRNLRSQLYLGVHGAPQSPLGAVWTTDEALAYRFATIEGTVLTVNVSRSVIDWTATIAHRIFLDRTRGANIVLIKGSKIKDISGIEWTI